MRAAALALAPSALPALARPTGTTFTKLVCMVCAGSPSAGASSSGGAAAGAAWGLHSSCWRPQAAAGNRALPGGLCQAPRAVPL